MREQQKLKEDVEARLTTLEKRVTGLEGNLYSGQSEDWKERA